MPSSGMLHHAVLVRTGISEECRIYLHSVHWLLVTADVVNSSLIPVLSCPEYSSIIVPTWLKQFRETSHCNVSTV
jgi:hypothetical protein